MLTALVEPKLNVGGSCAPAGLDVIAAVRTTLPVKVAPGLTVIVEVVVDPGLMFTGVPVMMKMGGVSLNTTPPRPLAPPTAAVLYRLPAASWISPAWGVAPSAQFGAEQKL